MDTETLNGMEIPIKEEPVDPQEDPLKPKEPFLANGIHEDSDCDDTSFFTQIEVENTKRCLENTRLIIKDYETQLDWHLQQYMMLRNGLTEQELKEHDTRKPELLSISQLSALIANHPEGNKNFIKRRVPERNGNVGRRRRKKGSEDEESETSEEDSDDYDEDYEEEEDSDEADNPSPRKKRRDPEVKDEIEEEIHELVEPKMEQESDEEEMEEDEEDEEEEEEEVPVKAPAKRGRKPGKKGKGGSVDLTGAKQCKIMLTRIDDVKDEKIDKDELIPILKRKSVTSFDDLYLDDSKGFLMLNDENIEGFDFDECNKKNVIILFEEDGIFPEYVFTDDVSKHVLNDTIKLVQASVYEMYMKRSEA